MDRRYFTPSEYKLLQEVQAIFAKEYGEFNAEQSAFLTELENAGLLTIPGKLHRDAINDLIAIAYTDKHIAEENQRAVEKAATETTETFQTVASSVRDYVKKEAGTKSVLQILYDVYARADVQRVCGSSIWLINRQIEIALSAYIQSHQEEAYKFCTQDPKKPADF